MRRLATGHPRWSQGLDSPGDKACDEPSLGLSSICVQVSSKETVSGPGSCEGGGGLEQGEAQPHLFCTVSDGTNHGGILVSAPTTNQAPARILHTPVTKAAIHWPHLELTRTTGSQALRQTCDSESVS